MKYNSIIEYFNKNNFLYKELGENNLISLLPYFNEIPKYIIESHIYIAPKNQTFDINKLNLISQKIINDKNPSEYNLFEYKENFLKTANFSFIENIEFNNLTFFQKKEKINKTKQKIKNKKLEELIFIRLFPSYEIIKDILKHKISAKKIELEELKNYTKKSLPKKVT